jgi:D-alanyl-lipoteichoic acid acyltransferase DltB (MBOAT superfamily)
MSLSDFIKENVYLPYFRRHSARARSQQVLLGVAIGAFVIAGMVGWWLWSRRGGGAASMDGVTPSGA